MISYFRLSILMFLFWKHGSSTSLVCSNKKVDNMCACKRVIDEKRSVPVTVVDCAMIDLQVFPDFSQLNQDVNVLDLSHNKITALKQQIYQFDTTSLTRLDLSYNFVDVIEDDFFKNMINLEELILGHNNLTALKSDGFLGFLKNLVYLDLSFNNIKVLQENVFVSLTQLRHLDLSYNDENLGQVLMQSSDFLSGKVGLSTNITHLVLNKVGIKDIYNKYFEKYTELRYLSLTDNHLENIPSVPYTLEYLDLSGSDITALQAKYLNYHSLKVLKLNRMKKLDNIHKYAFYNLQALRELSITDCRNLREFNELVFGLLFKNSVLSLEKLSLARNSLETLNYTYKHLFNKLEHVDLRDNPWRCDCDILWLQECDNFYKDYSVQCASPYYLKGKVVGDLTEEDLRKCHPEKYGKVTHRILIPILIVMIITLSGLIGYLIYYSPKLYGGRLRVGPDSPYSPTRSQEN